MEERHDGGKGRGWRGGAKKEVADYWSEKSESRQSQKEQLLELLQNANMKETSGWRGAAQAFLALPL